MPFKLDPSCAYFDTDSVFTNDTLGIIKIGGKLGLFKDELAGQRFKEARINGTKQYGYTFEMEGRTINKSVFAGVERDSLSFDEVKIIAGGSSITKQSKTRFKK